MKKPEIVYSPQECDAKHCHDDFCPYIHSPMWQYRKEDMTLSDGYDSEQEAIEGYYLEYDPWTLEKEKAFIKRIMDSMKNGGRKKG